MRNALITQLAGLILLPAMSWAEQQINTRAPYGQTYPDVAIDGADNYIAVWRSYRQDGSSGGIYFQRLDAEGLPLGRETRVNTSTEGDQSEPAVAGGVDGRFVIVWHGPGPNEVDILCRLFDPNGDPLAGEFLVNATTEGMQRYPRASMRNDGSFIVVWQNEATGVNQYDRAGSFQMFSAEGSPIGPESQFSGVFDCRYPDVAAKAGGGFVIVWMRDEGGNAVQMRLYDDVCNAQTDPCKVNDVAFTSVTKPHVAMNKEGSFVISWDGHDEYASLDDIHAKLFDPNANAAGDQFLVNTTLEGKQERPDASITDSGSFLIAWHGDTGNSGHGKDIFGQVFDGLGSPVGQEFCPHVRVLEDQKDASVAMSESGSFLAVWQSYKQDGSDYGIFGMLGPSTWRADFTGDNFVNFRDFAIMARSHLAGTAAPPCDLDGDGKVDLVDAQMLCSYWLGP